MEKNERMIYVKKIIFEVRVHFGYETNKKKPDDKSMTERGC